jgi:N-acetyltransferase
MSQGAVPPSTMAPMLLTPCILAGQTVRLEPLESRHLDGLADAALHEDLWRWTTTRITEMDDVHQYLSDALRDAANGTALVFATVHATSGRVIGSTRFANADARNRRVEIGWTFLHPEWQRTRANTEAKYLMLRHAFTAWNCVRVEFKTDRLNTRSRRAILRIGAQEEGTLRQHMIVWDGRIRDTVYFSILHSEWPAVAAALEEKLSL